MFDSIHGSLEGVLANAVHERPKIALTLREHADQLRVFREVATLRALELEPPPDRETDLEAGAQAALGLGLRRLAERIETAGSLERL